MGLLRKLIRIATRPIRSSINGKVGESKVNSKLNPLIFGVVEHKQINNLVLVDNNGKSHQIDHIEIRHNGIFCIETKNYKGWIFGGENQDQWTQTLYHEKHKFLNPLKQNKSHIYQISRVLNNKYKVNSVVVMVQNNANNIRCKNVVNLNDLKSYLKNFNDGTCLTTNQMEEIYVKLMNAASNMTNSEHVQNIRQTQKEFYKGICPRCGGKLVLKKGKYGDFIGCSNYPKCRFISKIK